MQLVAINVSMVFRTVTPSDRNVLKLSAAWTAMSEQLEIYQKCGLQFITPYGVMNAWIA
jgi:hypothetical protein